MVLLWFYYGLVIMLSLYRKMPGELSLYGFFVTIAVMWSKWAEVKYRNSVLRCVNTSVCQQGAILFGRAHYRTLSVSCPICCSIKAEYPTCIRIMR